MAFRLSKTESKQLAEHRETLGRQRDKVLAEFEWMKENVEAAVEKVNDEIREYNLALADARSFVEAVAEVHRGNFDDRSDGWKDGDRGQAADSWISEWEGVSLDDIDEVEIVEPDEPSIGEHIEALENLPEEVDA